MKWKVRDGVVHLTHRNYFALLVITCILVMWVGSGSMCLPAPQAKEKINKVESVAFSPDGRRLATAHADGAMRLWDVRTGRLGRVLDLHRGAHAQVGFYADRTILMTSSGWSARLWNTKTWKAKTFVFAYEPNNHLTFRLSPNGKLLAVIDRRTVKMMDAGTGKQLYILKDQQDARSISFSPNNQFLLIDGALYDARSGRQSGAPITGVAGLEYVEESRFSPDSRTIYLTYLDAHAGYCYQFLVDAATRRQINSWQLDGALPHPFEFSPNNRSYIVGTTQTVVATKPTIHRLNLYQTIGSMTIGDLPTGKFRRKIPVGNGDVRDIKFSADGQTLATINYTFYPNDDKSKDKWIYSAKLWQVKNGKNLHTLCSSSNPELYCISIFFSPDGKRLATGHANGSVSIWSTKDGELLRVLKP